MRFPRWSSVALLAFVAVGCAGEPETVVDGDQCEGLSTLTVLAASSLAEVFDDSEQAFVDEHRCIDDILFSFGSSASLAAQVVNGSPVDVFVAASRKTMQTVVDTAVTKASPVEFARNEASLMISTRSDEARSVGRLTDLTALSTAGLTVGVCAASVPCGALADMVLDNAARAYGEPNLTRTRLADTEATSVEDLVTKIQLGEIDAGITYVSDCAGAVRSGGVRCVEIPTEVNASTDLSAIAVTDRSAAHDFVAFLVGEEMQRRLQSEYGFGAPG